MRILATLSFLLSTIVTATTAPAATRANEGEQWLKLTSEHFDMLTSADEYESMHILIQFEQFRELFSRIIPQVRSYEAKPLIFIFNANKQNTPYLLEGHAGKIPSPTGRFMGGQLQPRIMMPRIRTPLANIFRLYVRSLVYVQLGRNAPLWLVEGLGGVVDTSSMDEDTVTFGTTRESYLQSISRTPPMPLDILFKVNYRSPQYKKGGDRLKFYAQSWLLLHYAMFSKNNESHTLENLLRFSDESSHPTSITTATFEKIFTTNYENLERALEAYMRAEEYRTSVVTVPTKPIRDKITTRPATDDEHEIELTGLVCLTANSPDALAALIELEKKYPENPRVYEILAEAHQRQGNLQTAMSYLAKAVKKDTANPMVYLELLKDKNIEPGKPGRLMSAKAAAEYTALVDRALELAPDCMEAYEMLALIESQTPDIRTEKLNVVLEALPSIRKRDATRLALATIYWRLKRHDKALATLDEVMKDPKSSNAIKGNALELQQIIGRTTDRSATAKTATAPLPQAKQSPRNPSVHAFPASERWLKLTSEHFEMFSCISERESVQLLTQLGQFREFFFRMIPQSRINDPKPLIFIFDTREHYERYIREDPDEKKYIPSGLYFGGQLQSRIMVRQVDRFSREMMVHEYVHSLLSTRLKGRVPPWFDEGLAGVFETSIVNGNTITFGRAEEIRLKTIIRTPPIPLGTLFTVKHNSPYYQGGGPETAKFYALSWLLLHYAMLGKNNEPYTLENLLRFVDEASHPKIETAKAFEKVFNSNYKNLENTLNSYIRTGRYATATATIPAEPIRDKIITQLASDGEIEIELAGLAWRSKMTPTTVSSDALADVRNLEKKYPENPRIYEILAETQIRMGNDKAASHYLTKAAEKNATNPKVYVELLKYNHIKPDKPGRLMSVKTVVKNTTLIDRALELAPDFMEAYELLAIIESQNPAIRIEKMNAVLEALPHMRERDKTHYALATVYWRLKRNDEAQEVINKLMADPKSSDEMKRHARELQRVIAKETGKNETGVLF